MQFGALIARRIICVMAETLLAPPQGCDEERSSVERKPCSYENLSSRFRLTSRRFTQQYSQIYAVRLMETRPLLEPTAKKKWGKLKLIGIKLVIIKIK